MQSSTFICWITSLTICCKHGLAAVPFRTWPDRSVCCQWTLKFPAKLHWALVLPMLLPIVVQCGGEMIQQLMEVGRLESGFNAIIAWEFTVAGIDLKNSKGSTLLTWTADEIRNRDIAWHVTCKVRFCEDNSARILLYWITGQFS